MTTQLEPVTISLNELDGNPHEIFRHYRPIMPLIRRDDGAYIAIRARDVERLITDARTRQVETELAQSRGVTDGALLDFYKNTMLFTNGPDHRRRRGPLSRTFGVQLVAALRPRIRAIAEKLIDEVRAQKQMSFLDHYCSLIPARIISDIVGLPEADIPRFTSCVYSMSRAVSSTFRREDVPEIEQAARELTLYVRELLAERRIAPKDDFLTSFAKAVEEENKLSPMETLIQIVTIILAGSDTTRIAMAIQVALLLQHREQWEAVCQYPALIPGAVSEALRYEPAVGSVPRFTLEDIEIDGFVVPRGRMLSLSTLSALRDPERHSLPDCFDIRRADLSPRHLVFGGGVHRCLGEALARAELEESLAALTARLPHLQLAGGTPTLLGHNGVRRMTDMRVSWS
jgi:cytochrome P450